MSISFAPSFEYCVSHSSHSSWLVRQVTVVNTVVTFQASHSSGSALAAQTHRLTGVELLGSRNPVEIACVINRSTESVSACRAAFQCGANQTGTPIRPPVADYCVSFSANACGGEVIVCRTSRCCSSVRHFITTQWWPLSPRMEVPKGTYIRASVCKSRMPFAAQAQAVLNAPWDSPHLAAPGVRRRRRIMGASGGRR